jgi:glutathione synthetase
MRKYSVLILTDHSNHSKENSLYPLAKAMLQHELTHSIDIVSRANVENNSFFNCDQNAEIFAMTISEKFAFTENGLALSKKLKSVNPITYDLIWLRMPPPLSKRFLGFIQGYFKQQVIINNPSGIYETGSKEFLINFPDLCPPLKICNTIEDIISFKKRFPIVLKPFREYGGRGIVKIVGDDVWLGKEKMSFKHFIENLEDKNLEYLGVKYLKNVSEGDKRIVVVNGQIMGASLRLPPKDSWVCNVAMGGSSNVTKVDEDEKVIIEKINPILSKMGIVMYGVDTLMGDDGKRVLSEINTTSIGGLPQISQLKKLPLVEQAIDLIWEYFLKNKKMLDNTEYEVKTLQELNIEDAPKGAISRYWLEIVKDGMGVPVRIPVIIARGKTDGKTVGLTAALHGNELNGIPVIQRLFNELDVKQLRGTIVGIPILNVPSYLRKKRRFLDGTDLNHIMPGKPNGTVSQVYAWRVVNKIVKHFDYLLDLHTASNGRMNSYYIRADMSDEVVRRMALLQNAQIIIHNPPSDGTLRGTADELEIPAITLEVGNPNSFQKGMIRDGLTGIHNLLGFLKMTDSEVEEQSAETVLCKKSYWLYTDTGGLLTVHPVATQIVEKGEKIATLRNVFGDIIKEYKAPERGVIIGKSVSPVNQAGGRILHLGIIKKQ